MAKIPNLKAIRDWVRQNVFPLANNLLTTEAGYGMDARQGPVIQGEIDEINGKLLNMIPYPDYSKGVAITGDIRSGYIAPSNGLVVVRTIIYDQYYAVLNVNGAQTDRVDNHAGGYVAVCLSAFVKSGDTAKYVTTTTGSADEMYANFYPAL